MICKKQNPKTEPKHTHIYSKFHIAGIVVDNPHIGDYGTELIVTVPKILTLQPFRRKRMDIRLRGKDQIVGREMELAAKGMNVIAIGTFSLTEHGTIFFKVHYFFRRYDCFEEWQKKKILAMAKSYEPKKEKKKKPDPAPAAEEQPEKKLRTAKKKQPKLVTGDDIPEFLKPQEPEPFSDPFADQQEEQEPLPDEMRQPVEYDEYGDPIQY